MPTTTIRLDPGLKARLTRLAKRSGQSPHSVMLSAIEELVSREERRESFLDEAEARWADFQKNRMGLPFAEVEDWLLATAEGRPAVLPPARKLRR